MSKKIFFDANIIMDLFDTTRISSVYSAKVYRYVVRERFQLYTSCDIITTLYYVDAKRDKKEALNNIEKINKILKITEFSNKEVARTCTLMKEDPNYHDLKDTLQYILAKKEGCDLIISNDENFYAADIEVVGSREFCARVGVV